jgi:hypothetical protein
VRGLDLSDRLDGQRRALTKALEQVVRDLLPDALRRYEAFWDESLVVYLSDPIDFTEVLNEALFDILIQPFSARYLAMDEDVSRRRVQDVRARRDIAVHGLQQKDDVLALIAEAMGQNTGALSEQLLADLETLEWIVLGQPADGAKCLAEMRRRYAHPPTVDETEEERATIRQRVNECVLYLWNNWSTVMAAE